MLKYSDCHQKWNSDRCLPSGTQVFNTNYVCTFIITGVEVVKLHIRQFKRRNKILEEF